MGIKVIDGRCMRCEHVDEYFVDSSLAFGEIIPGDGKDDRCSQCGWPAVAMPVCCPVRTPNNSVSYITGHHDDGGQHSRTVRKLDLEIEHEQAVGMNQHKEAAEIKREWSAL
jgi:hypothetical protein